MFLPKQRVGVRFGDVFGHREREKPVTTKKKVESF